MPERCGAKPKPTSSPGHVLILCRSSMDGLLMQREVGVVQRRDVSGPAITKGDFMGNKSFLLLLAELVVRPVWPRLALPQGRGGRAAGAWD